MRSSQDLSVAYAGSLTTLLRFKTVEEWRRELPRLDRVGCKRVKITFCGRPWMTFLVEMDGSQRVGKVGPLSVSAD